MNFWTPSYIYDRLLTGADLEEDHDDEDGVADGEDPPQHSHCFGVPHELPQENITGCYILLYLYFQMCGV